MQAGASTDAGIAPPVARLIGRSELRLWNLPQAERWRRHLARAGVALPGDDGTSLPADGAVILARADYVLDDGLIRALVASPDTVLAVTGDGGTQAAAAHVPAARVDALAALLAGPQLHPEAEALGGLSVLGPAELGRRYNVALRKRARPYAIRLTPQTIAEAERRTFDGAYKGVTDIVTKYLWPAPARAVTRWCAALGVSPNMVTTVSLVCVLLALWLFAIGAFWAGLVVAWIMTFLDTVDGKLARVTLTSSRWGNVFDHGIDLVHPPFWYWAWWYGVVSSGAAVAGWAVSAPALWVVIAGYVAGRLMEGLFIWRFGMEIHVWRRIDSLFRLVTARRNPNLVLLSAATLAGRPDIGFGLVAVWTALSLIFHAVRIVQAAVLRYSGRTLVSWLAEADAAPAGSA